MMLKKLSTKFILIFSGVLTAVFVVMIVIVQFVAMRYVENYIEYNIQLTQEDIDKGVNEIVDEAAYLYSRMVKFENTDLLNSISDGNTSNIRKNAFVDLVHLASMSSYFFVDMGWYNMGAVNAGEFFSVNGYTSPSEALYKKAELTPNSLVLGEYKNGCTILSIYMSNDMVDATGCFVFYLMEDVISEVFNILGVEVEYSFIMDTSGYVFSHENKELLGKTIVYQYLFSLETDKRYQTAYMDGEQYIIVVRSMDNLNEHYDFDCYLVSALDYDQYYGDFNRLTLILILVAGAALLVGITLAIYRAKSITKSVENLNGAINNVIETGDMSKKTANKGDELYQLERNYDKMINHIFSLLQKNKEDMETQRKLELDSLQMQINPHFLYNTLDAIVWMAKIKQEPEIASLSINLAKFFRLSLHKGDKYIMVWEEIELVEHYLEIDKIRFPSKVTVKFEIKEKIKNYKMLKLLLQPVVENTLKYAFPDGPGTMTIRAYGDDDDLVFEVEDDGVGFDVGHDILEKKDDNKSPGTGYGLYNVNERIKLEYGENYGLVITSEKGKGTKVVIRITKKI